MGIVNENEQKFQKTQNSLLTYTKQFSFPGKENTN